MANSIVTCSFCGKRSSEVRVMLVGPVNVAICSDCVVAACDQVVDHARAKKPVGRAIEFADNIDVAAPSSYISTMLGKSTRAMTMAQERFPQPNYTLLKVAEECGELVKAAIHYRERREIWENVEGEAIQAIAMILRLLEEGDAINGVIPPA